MAVLLKQQYDLLALVLSMEIAGDAARVRCAVEGSQAGERIRLGEWPLPAAEIGIPQRLDRSGALYEGYPFHLPDDLLQSLAALLDEQASREETLWLHITKPQGYLPLVPWEQLLYPALQRPMVRLPDFLVDPTDVTPGELDVVLCSSQPAAKEAFMASEHLAQMAARILSATPRPVTVHVFTDVVALGDVEARLRNAGLSERRVRLYNPADAPDYTTPDATKRIVDPGGQITNPWLLWMRHALRARSVDVVHFMVHGYMQRDAGALALAESPLENVDTRIARFVGVNELQTFLTQVGAWGCAVTSPPHNYSEMGLRLLADTLANIRPGPVLHHELRLDANLDALADAYGFLFATAAADPPASPALFLYCHPARVRRAGEPQPASIPAVPKGAGPKSEPGWYGAAMRYMDNRALELAKQKSYAAAAPRSATREEAVGSSDTLRQLQQIVEEVAQAEAEAGSREEGQP